MQSITKEKFKNIHRLLLFKESSLGFIGLWLNGDKEMWGQIQKELCLESEMYSLYRVSISFILQKLIQEHRFFSESPCFLFCQHYFKSTHSVKSL